MNGPPDSCSDDHNQDHEGHNDKSQDNQRAKAEPNLSVAEIRAVGDFVSKIFVLDIKRQTCLDNKNKQ